jgi:ubiquinone/menaquinone biosynthesis C-methylase UbiE
MDIGRFHTIVKGYWESQILFSAMKLGIFDLIGGGDAAAGEIASSLSLDPENSELFLDALSSMGFLRKGKGRYRNSELTKRHLMKTSKRPLYGFVLHHSHMWEQWGKLPSLVKKRNPRALLSPEGSLLKRDIIYDFALAMHHGGSEAARDISKLCGFKSLDTILDVGGCTGRYSLEIARTTGASTIHILDLPEMARAARKILKVYDEKSYRTLKYVRGNFFEVDPPILYDLAIVSNILHSLGPAECVTLLGRIRKWLKESGRLLIHDLSVGASGTLPYDAALFAINMLVNTPSGRVYREKEMVSFAKEAGFVQFERKRTKGKRLVLICSR